MDTEQTTRPFHRRHKGAILLVALLLLILLTPLIQLFKDSKLLDMMLTTLVVAASVNAISHRKRSIVYIAACLASLAVIFGWVEAFYTDDIQRTENFIQASEIHQTLFHSLAAMLYMFVAFLLFKVILIEDAITVDQIFSGVVIYMLIGLTWGHFYALTDIFNTESISGISVSTNTMKASSSEYMYFSFVTLTTLGYGDMFPVAPIDKALAIIEAITGVMFVAILVSTLVGRVNMKR